MIFHGLTCFVYLYSFWFTNKRHPLFFFCFFFDVLFLRQACKRMDRALGAMKPFCCKHLNQIFDVQLTPMYWEWVGLTEYLYTHKNSKCNRSPWQKTPQCDKHNCAVRNGRRDITTRLPCYPKDALIALRNDTKRQTFPAHSWMNVNW